MKPATTIADNGAFSVQKSIFEFALRARKITILGALATQFHEISELESLMTLKFHTLKHIGVCCLLRRNLAVPLILMGQDCACPAILIHFFQK